MEAENRIEQYERIIRATTTDVNSFESLRNILEERKRAANVFLKSSGEDTRRQCLEIINYCDDIIKKAIL